ncbi:MAG TPA: efflux RND transporter periplasmic adaptor subunit [Candidatus Margulisiibacteriota bacterium]|nr:efflux RND transporter periplasmic adaptor subunit [Candidatus Margulisiibacteriota bacterium]
MSRRAGVILAVGIVVGAVVWWRWMAVREQANRAIGGSGIIEVTEVDVAFEVPGTIAERYVDEGALLDKGEPIARLDDKEYRLQVDRATAAQAAAEARYRLLLKGPRGQEIDQALAAVEAADTEFETQQREYARAKALYDRQVVSRSEFDKVNSTFTEARSRRDRAYAQLDMLKEGYRTEEVEEGRARLREAEKALALAELNLGRCQLFAPVAGRVLSKNREAGETVPAGASIVTLGDLNRPWLNLYIGERDLGKVSLGMKAEVTVDSFPSQPFPGKVTFISDKAEFTPKNIQTQDERVKLVYRIKIEVENRNQALKPGMPADGSIPLNHDGSDPLSH